MGVETSGLEECLTTLAVHGVLLPWRPVLHDCLLLIESMTEVFTAASTVTRCGGAVQDIVLRDVGNGHQAATNFPEQLSRWWRMLSPTTM